MPLLRLTQTASGDDRYRVEIAYEGDGAARRTAQADVTFRDRVPGISGTADQVLGISGNLDRVQGTSGNPRGPRAGAPN